MKYIIGIDFDNTIADYDEVIHRVAVQRGLIRPTLERSKKRIRDRIRSLPDGEIEWQKVQAIVYGPDMPEARLSGGVKTFLRSCREHRVRVHVVSHKTEYAKLDTTGTNLRAAALNWMRAKGFFERDGVGLSERHVYFEGTRREKIERIRRLRCTHFIDDLEETFIEDSFPTDVEKILFAPHMQHSSLQGVSVFATWEEIDHYLFDAAS